MVAVSSISTLKSPIRVMMISMNILLLNSLVEHSSFAQDASKPQALFRKLTSVNGQVEGLTFSSDGLKLAYSLKGNIYMLSIADVSITQITDTPHDDSKPQWSPDAAQIAYQKDSAGQKSIWVYQINSDIHSRVTSIKENTFDPSWAPDGNSIAFSSDTYGSVDVMIKDFDDGRERRLTIDKSDEYIFGFHPNGKYVGYIEQNSDEPDIYAISLTGKEEFPLTRSTSYELNPTWSYDGSKVIYQIKEGDGLSVYTGEFPYGEATLINKVTIEHILPIISTNGRRVIYPIEIEGKSDLMLFDTKTKEALPINVRRELNNLQQPVWSLGGRILAASSFDAENEVGEIWLINISRFIRDRDR